MRISSIWQEYTLNFPYINFPILVSVKKMFLKLRLYGGKSKKRTFQIFLLTTEYNFKEDFMQFHEKK